MLRAHAYNLQLNNGRRVSVLARKPNYGFEKRKKERDRKAKKDAKREDRLRRRREGTAAETDQPTPPAQQEDPALGSS